MFTHKPQTKASKALRNLVHGVGINDAPYVTSYKGANGTHTCPYYTVWASMLERCYSPRLHARRPTYAGATLAPEWLSFMAFRQWMEQQDWQGKCLDKDLLGKGSLHYGPDTCLFISKELNNLLTLRTNGRGVLPLGVSMTTIKGSTYFVAQCSFYGKQKRLGYFKTVEEAQSAYNTAKLSHIKELAAKEKCPRVKQALLNIR